MADVGFIDPISRLLVANRGEIARRVIRTARELGISTVAVYADGDVDAPFVRMKRTSAIALARPHHGGTDLPGYRQGAQRLCAVAAPGPYTPATGSCPKTKVSQGQCSMPGLRWIGPSPEVIGLMGDKLSAKRLMREAGMCPPCQAIEIDAQTDRPCRRRHSIGYPGAGQGGGRRGRTRHAHRRAARKTSPMRWRGARREAAGFVRQTTGSFWRSGWTGSRHVEIQIIGDTHGNLVHCFERECSIQRRHQKIIEEAPSPAVTPEIAANAWATRPSPPPGNWDTPRPGPSSSWSAVKSSGSWKSTPGFQVEHPVTEEITGRDLVREQIRIAEGEELSFTQEDLSIDGHAIEARLYAEDPGERISTVARNGTRLAALRRPAARGSTRGWRAAASSAPSSIP